MVSRARFKQIPIAVVPGIDRQERAAGLRAAGRVKAGTQAYCQAPLRSWYTELSHNT
jgi:hypothetical protein